MPPRRLIGIDVRTSPRTGRTTYRVRWRDPTTHKQLSHSFTDRREAIDAKRSIELAGNRCYCTIHGPPGLEPGQYGARAQAPTWGNYARRHITNRPGVGEHYRAQFQRDLDRHLTPLLDLAFANVTRDVVAAWIRDLERAGLSATTIHRLTVQAGTVQRAAIDAGLATGNPFVRQRTGRRDRPQEERMHCLTHEEWGRLQAALPEGTPRDLAATLIGTGLRFGEVTALQVGAVTLDGQRGELRVERAWKSDGHNGWLLGPPKSQTSRRTITFGSAVAAALRPHLEGRAADELVFTAPEGTPIRNSNFAARVWRPAVAAAGLGRVRIHDLRHSHASWLLAEGRPLLAVSRRLGHESAAVTANVYSHVLPGSDEQDVAALDRIMPVSPSEDDSLTD